MNVVRFARPILQSCILGSWNNLKIRGIPPTKFEYVYVLLELKVQIKFKNEIQIVLAPILLNILFGRWGQKTDIGPTFVTLQVCEA